VRRRGEGGYEGDERREQMRTAGIFDLPGADIGW
jgi:hypothetical protein